MSNEGEAPVVVEGVSVSPDAPVTLSLEALERGAIVALADRVALLLRRTTGLDAPAEALGLIGLSDGMVAVTGYGAAFYLIAAAIAAAAANILTMRGVQPRR